MDPKEYWEQVYSTEAAEELGWYTPHLQTSLGWIKQLDLPHDASILDIGGGASTLVDDLLEEGYRSITVLDVSKRALSIAQTRLGERSALVKWLEGDMTTVALPPHGYDLWHDRAMLHFLTDLEQQRKYRDQLLRALKPGGHVILGTFAPEAPPRCSGLPVQRYSTEDLEYLLGREFDLIEDIKERHLTPGGREQMYLYCRFRRRLLRG